MNVFLDTDVVLDVLARREPFYADAAAVWALSERKRIDGFVSAVSTATLYFLVRKLASPSKAESMLRDLRACVRFAPCDAVVMDRAIDARFADPEDALQYFSAQAAGADVLVTRHVGRFASAPIPALTPRAFLAAHSFR